MVVASEEKPAVEAASVLEVPEVEVESQVAPMVAEEEVEEEPAAV